VLQNRELVRHSDHHLGLCVEEADYHKKDIVLCYLDFKGAFPSTDHNQLIRILEFLGLPSDFTRLVSSLYIGGTIGFITPHGRTSPVEIRRCTLQGDPLSPSSLTLNRSFDGSLPRARAMTLPLAASIWLANGTPMTAPSSPTQWRT